MHAHDSVLDESTDWKVIEQCDETFPEFDAIPSSALLPEPINTRYILALVISAKKENSLGVFYLICKKKADCFY